MVILENAPTRSDNLPVKMLDVRMRAITRERETYSKDSRTSRDRGQCQGRPVVVLSQSFPSSIAVCYWLPVTKISDMVYEKRGGRAGRKNSNSRSNRKIRQRLPSVIASSPSSAHTSYEAGKDQSRCFSPVS